VNKPKKERFAEPPEEVSRCTYEHKDCEGLSPDTDDCDCGENWEDDYYEPSEYDEWMDFDPDC